MLYVQITVILLVPILVSTAKNDAEVKCTDEYFEHLFAQLSTIGESGKRFPETFDQIPQYCIERTALLKKFDQYKKQCLKSSSSLKNIISIVLYSSKANMKKICGKKRTTFATKFINSAGCINQNNKSIQKCLDKITENLAGVIKVKNRLKMPYVCCQYVILNQCIVDSLRDSACEAKTTPISELIHSVFGGFSDSTCGEYNADTDKCDRLAPVPKVNNPSKSFIRNIVAIFDSIDHNDKATQ